ncbi:MAG: hypothetical protein AB1352_03370 [Patescibacteria group bacterium]
MNTATITANDALAFLQKTIERSDTKRFAVITDPLVGTITLEPFDDEDANQYYELSPEGEASLKESLTQAARGEVYPIETLFPEQV